MYGERDTVYAKHREEEGENEQKRAQKEVKRERDRNVTLAQVEYRTPCATNACLTHGTERVVDGTREPIEKGRVLCKHRHEIAGSGMYHPLRHKRQQQLQALLAQPVLARVGR